MWDRWRIKLEAVVLKPIAVVWGDILGRTWQFRLSFEISPTEKSSKGLPLQETNLLETIKNVSASMPSSSSR